MNKITLFLKGLNKSLKVKEEKPILWFCNLMLLGYKVTCLHCGIAKLFENDSNKHVK